LDDNLIAKIQREIDLGYGDSRLRFILNWVKSGRPLFECDKRYLARHLVHYAENETKRYEKFDAPLTKVEHHVKNIQESMEDSDVSRVPKPQRSLISDVPESDDTAIRQVNVIVEMRKDLHHILVRLDQLEEKFREEAQREKPKYEVAHRERPTYEVAQRERPTHSYDTPRERHSTVLERPREKPKEKKEEVFQSAREIPKDKPGLVAFAIVLSVITVVTIGFLFAAMVIFSIPALSEKFQGYGITYDKAKQMLNWFMPVLIIYLGAWASFGLLYLQSTKKAKKR